MQRIQRVSPNLFINAHQKKDLQRKYLMRPSSVNRSIIRHWNYSKTVIEAVEESRIQGLTGCNTQRFSSKWYDNEIISINSYYYHLDEMKGNGEGWIQNFQNQKLQTMLVNCSRLNLILDSLLVLHWIGPRVYVSCNVNCVYLRTRQPRC